jgi:hypothetical protein
MPQTRAGQVLEHVTFQWHPIFGHKAVQIN